MVRDTAPRRSRLIRLTTIAAFASACASGPPEKHPSLGRLTHNPTGYPEVYPVAEVHAAKATDILADDPAMAPMRPNPWHTPEGVKQIQRKFLPEEAKPKPPPPPPLEEVPAEEAPIVDENPASILPSPARG